MRMKKLLLSALCLLVSLLAMGEPVNSKKALEIAANYLAKSGAPRRAAAKDYTFTATGTTIYSNYLDAATALNFKFVGITSKPAYEQVYMLNADGTKFEKNTNPAFQSFRGCFVPTYGATNLPDALIVKGTTTGINTIQVSDAKTDDGYYNLAGQRVNADFKGIVIHHGRKMLKK